MRKDFKIFSRKNNLLRTSFYSEGIPEKDPLIILVHGFKGFKDWGYGPYLCDFLAKNKFSVLSFNFSHSGIGEDLQNFTELEKFANNTISLELEELGDIIDAYFRGEFGFIPENKKKGIIGHSRGGAIGIIKTAEDPRISALVSWASVAHFNRYTEHQKKLWREQGYLEIENSRTKQIMKLNSVLLDDIENNQERFNCVKRAAEIKVPFLIVHGELDIVVPVKEAYQIFEAAKENKNAELFVVEKANHTFDIVHPFEGSNKKFDSVIQKTLEFFNKHLKIN